eukprot:GHVS01079187.1.p2 GENE.GHVS01079187.1~~GHVS01079187.1.p2  ORF type:complete len:295 (+),score=77.97 GHVS01079187.1:49-933(+)
MSDNTASYLYVAVATVIAIALSALWRRWVRTTVEEGEGGGGREGGRNEGNEERRPEVEEPSADDALLSSRAQKKKVEKEMKKEEKKNLREFQQKERERKQGTLTAKEEALKKRQDEKENIINAQEEAERKALEQRRAKDDEEYRKWKTMFAVEGEGESSSMRSAREDALLLNQFVDYIKSRKTAELEEVAAEFDMKTPEVINRLQDLDKFGRLTGIFDERGKFIYITPEEMAEVAHYLKAKGRITISTDLVAACNRIIRLTPTDEDREKIQEENRKALELLTEVLEEKKEGEAS